MTKLLKKYFTEFISVAITASLAGIAFLKNHQDTAFIIGSFGSIATWIFHGLRNELENLIENKICNSVDILSKLNSIKDPDLKSEIIWEIEKISEGFLSHHRASERRLKRVKIAKRIRASALHEKPHHLYEWKSSWLKKWYEATLDVIKRGGSVERNFLLKKEFFIIDGIFDEESIKILSGQQTDGVSVRIVWIEDVEAKHQEWHRNICKNFTIFDENEVLETDTTGQRMFLTPSKTIGEDIDLFSKQVENFSEELKDVIEKYSKVKICKI